MEEKKKVVSMLKNYEVIDSQCNWIHFNNQDDNRKTKEILEKHKVLVKYCGDHHYGFREKLVSYDNSTRTFRTTIF